MISYGMRKHGADKYFMVSNIFELALSITHYLYLYSEKIFNKSEFLKLESRVPVGRMFISLLHPDQLWGPPSLLSNGYQETFLWG
jgi:hypothetical protein